MSAINFYYGEIFISALSNYKCSAEVVVVVVVVEYIINISCVTKFSQT